MEHILNIEDVDLRVLYGANNDLLRQFKGYFPKAKLVARGNLLKIQGSAEDIASFCELNFGVTFPLFEKILLKQSLEDAAELILSDRKHLDNNPKEITKKQIITLLDRINSGNLLD